MINKVSKKLQMSVLLASVIIILSGQCAYAESLYVFYPTIQRPHVIRQKMNKGFSNIELSVFGRFRDFKKKIASAPPDAILTKTPVIEQIGGYSIKLRGSRDGSADEPYVLLSVNRKTDMESISGTAIGILGILDRKGMKQFVGDYLSPLPKLRRVLKLEDLLDLLTLKMAEAVLIPEYYVSYYKKRSELNFAVTSVPDMRIGIIALAVKDEKSASSVVKAVKNMDNVIMTILGIDKWEK